MTLTIALALVVSSCTAHLSVKEKATLADKQIVGFSE